MRTWLMVCVLGAAAAWAGPKKPAVVLSGPPALTKLVAKELGKKFALKVLKTAVAAQPTAKEVRDVTSPDSAIALVLCQAAGATYSLQVLNGADGTPIETVSGRGKKLAKSDVASLIAAVNSGQAPGQPATAAAPTPAPAPTATPAPAPVAKDEPKKDPAPVATSAPPAKKAEPAQVAPAPVTVEQPGAELVSRPVAPALRASLGFGGFNRSFVWAGNPSPALAKPSQPFSGSVMVDVDWFPAAHFTSGFAANFGAFFSGEFGLGMVSKTDDDSRFAHTASRYRFGGQFRLPVGTAFALAVHAGYARQELTTSRLAVNDGTLRPNLPDVLFNGFRAGLGLRVRLFGTFEVDAAGGFQLVAGKGELASAAYFPKATAFAVDAGGGLSIELAEHLRLRAGVEWQKYFVTLNPVEGAAYYAKTVSDQYITATGSLQWVM